MVIIRNKSNSIPKKGRKCFFFIIINPFLIYLKIKKKGLIWPDFIVPDGSICPTYTAYTRIPLDSLSREPGLTKPPSSSTPEPTHSPSTLTRSGLLMQLCVKHLHTLFTSSSLRLYSPRKKLPSRLQLSSGLCSSHKTFYAYQFSITAGASSTTSLKAYPIPLYSSNLEELFVYSFTIIQLATILACAITGAIPTALLTLVGR